MTQRVIIDCDACGAPIPVNTIYPEVMKLLTIGRGAQLTTMMVVEKTGQSWDICPLCITVAVEQWIYAWQTRHRNAAVDG